MKSGANLLDRWFWAFCVGAALLGLLFPAPLSFIAENIRILLGSILFFTGLRLNFRAAWSEIRRPGLALYAAGIRLIVLPLLVYQAARLVLPPPLAVGVLIVVAMPSGTACSSLADVVRGNASLALVGTLATSLACPLVTPWVVEFGSGIAGSAEPAFLLRQMRFLALILFVPLGAAFGIRRLAPGFANARREWWSALSLLSLFVLIAGALASVSEDFHRLVREQPAQAIGLFFFMAAASAFMHLAGYWIAPWRSASDRMALSVNMAYVNNGLGIVFAVEFFKENPDFGVAAVLPAIFLEIPMALMLIPCKRFMLRRRAATEAGGPA